MTWVDGIKLTDEEIHAWQDRLTPVPPSFKFELDQEVFFLRNDKITTDKVSARVLIEQSNKRCNYEYIEVDVGGHKKGVHLRCKQHAKNGGVMYVVKEGKVHHEEDLHASKQDLLNSL